MSPRLGAPAADRLTATTWQGKLAEQRLTELVQNADDQAFPIGRRKRVVLAQKDRLFGAARRMAAEGASAEKPELVIRLALERDETLSWGVAEKGIDKKKLIEQLLSY